MYNMNMASILVWICILGVLPWSPSGSLNRVWARGCVFAENLIQLFYNFHPFLRAYICGILCCGSYRRELALSALGSAAGLDPVRLNISR